MGNYPKKESNKPLSVLVPRGRVGAIYVVEGHFDILPPVGVFAFIMEVSMVAQSGFSGVQEYVICLYHTGCFLKQLLLTFSTKMKLMLQLKPELLVQDFFHFGTENGEVQIK